MTMLFCLALLWYLVGFVIISFFFFNEVSAITLADLLVCLFLSVIGPFVLLILVLGSAESIVLWRKRK